MLLRYGMVEHPFVSLGQLCRMASFSLAFHLVGQLGFWAGWLRRLPKRFGATGATESSARVASPS